MGKFLYTWNPSAEAQDELMKVTDGSSWGCTDLRYSGFDDLYECFTATFAAQTRDWEASGGEEFMRFTADETRAMADKMERDNPSMARILRGSGGITIYS